MFKNLKFKIGEQYERWEFKLEIANDRLEGYDTYLFFSDKFTELTFELDILVIVSIRLENLLNTDILGSKQNLIIIFSNIGDAVFYYRVENTLIWYVLEDRKSHYILTYGKPKVMKKLFSFLY